MTTPDYSPQPQPEKTPEQIDAELAAIMGANAASAAIREIDTTSPDYQVPAAAKTEAHSAPSMADDYAHLLPAETPADAPGARSVQSILREDFGHDPANTPSEEDIIAVNDMPDEKIWEALEGPTENKQ